MAQDTLDAEIKTRIPTEQREALERIAEARHLKLSDILREAVREKLAAEAATEGEAQ